MLLRSILYFMSDTVRDYQTTPLASTEGMDDLFQSTSASAQEAEPLGLASEFEGAHGSAKGLASWFPIEQAAQRLGISKNAVQKRLKRGKLQGKKVAGEFGDIWLIDLSNETQILEVEFDASANPEQAKPIGSAFECDDKPGSAEGLASLVKVDLLLQVELLNRVERLSIENGRLAALLNERDSQIKLLTDSQHKGGWWAKFSSWFFKAR